MFLPLLFSNLDVLSPFSRLSGSDTLISVSTAQNGTPRMDGNDPQLLNEKAITEQINPDWQSLDRLC